MDTTAVLVVKCWDEMLDAIHVESLALKQTVEDQGVGAYEFWGARGTDVQWVAFLEGDREVSFDVTELGMGEDSFIQVQGKRSLTFGGCDGEHSGRCKRHCVEWEAEYVYRLVKVEYVNKHDNNGTRTIVTYEVEGK